MLTLHGTWHSGAAWRVRIALGLKRLSFALVPHDRHPDAPRDPACPALDPPTPVLDVGHGVLTQSLAILEWLEETHPTPPLLPSAAVARAHVRAMALAAACDVHPLHSLHVVSRLRDDLGADAAHVATWIGRGIGAGLAALEPQVARHGGLFAFGDAPTLADCALIPQVAAARRFGVDLSSCPTIVGIDARCATLPAFVRAHPDRQPVGAADAG